MEKGQPEKIVIVLHGSPSKAANNWFNFIKILSSLMERPSSDFTLAFLQFGEPNLESAIKDLIRNGIQRIVIHPLFLSPGHHVVKDIPEIIERTKKENPEIEITYTKPLGIHPKLAEIVQERLEEMGVKRGKEIEEKSFEIIKNKIDLSNFSEKEKTIIKRVIHATADFEYKDTLVFHPLAIERALLNLKEGKDILVDVHMTLVGISKKFLKGNRVLCYLSEIEEEPVEGTRTEKAIALALEREKNIGLVAIGNSPTALLKTIEILNQKGLRDIVVIGMPVGFVRALEAKILLTNQEFPFITNLSRKGGSPACCAVINALLRLAFNFN